MKYTLALGAAATLLSGASAHTWVEQLMNVGDNGTYYGAPGYIRNYIPRSGAGDGGQTFADSKLSWLSPQNGRVRISQVDNLCHPNQQEANYGSKFPALKSAPGNVIALRYLENGHVTQPQNQPGKVPGGGLVYIYATTNPQPGEKVANVLTWKTDGDLSKGRLLNVNPYDDGRCYQISSAPMSAARQAANPNPINGQTNLNHELWCQNNVQIPQDVSTDSLTMYWVWQWPTVPNVDPGLPKGKDEIYTSCMDIKMVSNKGMLRSVMGGSSLGAFEDPYPALPNFEERIANATKLTDNKAFYGPGSTFSAGPNGTAPVNPSVAQPGTLLTTFATEAPKSTPIAKQPAQQDPNVVYVTQTTVELVTSTVYDDVPAPATPVASPVKRSAKFIIR